MRFIGKFFLIFSLILLTFTPLLIYPGIICQNNKFNLKEDYYFEDDSVDLQEIYMSASGPIDKYNFKYFKIITFDHTKVVGSSNYTNFPVLISIFDIDLHDDVQSDGNDIAFANDTSWLDHEIELFNQEYNSTHAQLIAWVRVPILNVYENTNITMFYGNPYLSSQENPTGVWDKNYKGVWHMKEINPIDSTSNENNGTQSGGVINIDGKIYHANYFDGIDEFITIDNISSEIKTIEFWMNPSHLGSAGPSETNWRTASATGEDYNDWSTPARAYSSNDSYTSEGTPNDMQDWYNFNLNVPNGATINGIHLEIEGVASTNVGADVAISWNGGIDYTSEISRSWGFTEQNQTYGGSSEDWGRTWSSDDFKNKNLRVRLRRNAQSAGTILYIDCIKIKVYFSYVFMKIIDLNGTARIEIVEGDLITTNIPDSSMIYIDGNIESSLTTNWHHIAITITEGINISAMEVGRISTDYFDGVIDELRISDTVRNPELFNTSYYNQNDPKSFYNISSEVQFNIEPPVFSNLTENSNIIELGTNEIITINVTDISGIRQVLIEFEGINHSMTYIGGDLWQYDTWIPSQIGNYTYTIFMEDNVNTWNSVSDSIMVIDTTTPPTPIMISAPSSGDYSTLIFDWADGFDHSGISIYNLIIDNESNPYTTPGFLVNINITNTGTNSSYYELSIDLSPGIYYYFLYQIDGVGLRSNYTTDSFEIIKVSNGGAGITFLDLLPYILASIVASITVIIVLRKRIQKKIHPPRKKIPLKLIFSHINKIASSESTLKTEKASMILGEHLSQKKEIIEEEDVEDKINEIKLLAENLFNEGAYLEALKQYEIAEKLLLKLEREEEALFYSNLITNIKSLNKNREENLNYLEKERENNNFVNVMNLYINVIHISNKLKDIDMAEMYQSELIQLVKDGNLNITDLEEKRNYFEEQANSYLDQNLFEGALKNYEYCKEISRVLLQFDRVEENYNIDKFRNKIKEILSKIK
ncbi:MAG: DUF2341 domain-containing protein [Promethearchaeota archaeon]|nr:MAG: DUF2341 domain-containing protein [Candidatus Lokiarchaeota archaeon]